MEYEVANAVARRSVRGGRRINLSLQHIRAINSTGGHSPAETSQCMERATSGRHEAEGCRRDCDRAGTFEAQRRLRV